MTSSDNHHSVSESERLLNLIRLSRKFGNFITATLKEVLDLEAALSHAQLKCIDVFMLIISQAWSVHKEHSLHY